LALNNAGKRLAKRDGAVTLAELGVPRAWALITESLGWPAADPDELLTKFDPAGLPRQPWIYRG
jgi:glutamyl-tRNA synthetase